MAPKRKGKNTKEEKHSEAPAKEEKPAETPTKEAEKPAEAPAAEKKAAEEPKAEKKETPKPAEKDEPKDVVAVASAAEPSAPEEVTEAYATYDLTQKMMPFLDRHLILPILGFLREQQVYDSGDITRAEINLLAETNMLDFAMEQYALIEENVPPSLAKRREDVLKQLGSTHERILTLLGILEDEEQQKRITQLKSVQEIIDEFGLAPDVLDGLAQYAKLQFDCGDYSLSGELLKHYHSMMEKQGDDLSSRHVSGFWGALACFLLNKEAEPAADVIEQLVKFIESANSKLSKREVLLQKTWLLHWSLFAIFTNERPENKVLDFFLSEKNLSIISLSSPHLFRYVGACLILHKRLKHLVKELVSIIKQESGTYSDPVTRFLLALYVDVDLDEAQQELRKCSTVCQGDFFLSRHWPEFEENARLLIFETYCRLHQCINIAMIASKLNMEAEEAELWIVKLIQSAKLDARIDSEKHRVVMSKAPPSVYHQVIEKTKNLAFRSTMLMANLEKKEKEEKAEKAK